MDCSIKVQFSFLKLFNTIKKVTKAVPEGSYDEKWIDERADAATKQKFKVFNQWCKDNGVWHPKVKYPVLFGSGDSKYPGLYAMEEIQKNETMIRVPAKLIISTKKAYECKELQHIYYENPDVFGKHTSLGEDNVLDAYLLYHMSLGKDSFFYPYLQILPDDPDILMNWDEEDLEWLQDPTLVEDAEKGYDEFMVQWNTLYICLRKYTDLFKEKDIMMNKFKWVYILTTNRCFGSNWPGICQMVPFADFLNHENIDTNFDCQDETGKSITLPEMQKKEEEIEQKNEIIRLENEEKREFMRNIKTEILNVEVQLRNKMEAEGHSNQTQEEKQDREFSLQVMKQTQEQIEEMKKGDAEKKKLEDPGYASSGLESDNDLDLLVEQEVLTGGIGCIWMMGVFKMGREKETV